jgi:carbon storage regulator
MNMLVLTRRIGEQIVIDGNIRVMVVGVKGDKVQVGTSAPPSVTVDRSEVHERRGEFAYQWELATPATPADPFVESLAADLTDVAYRVALRHGMGNEWLELQLDLWRALIKALEKQSGSVKEVERSFDPRLNVD